MGLTVAVKRIFDPVITKELQSEFENEVELLSYLRHPNIVQVLGAWRSPPSLILVTEFMQRGSLFHVLHMSQVDITRERKLHFSRQIALALLFIHHSGVVHRDIKSHNFLVSENLTVKLCDFGLARKESQVNCEPAGTAAYLSPELWQGQAASKSSDIFAFGVLLWEIWAKEVPFDGLDASDIKARCLANTRPPISRIHSGGGAGGCPNPILQLIKQCWSAMASDRPTIERAWSVLQYEPK